MRLLLGISFFLILGFAYGSELCKEDEWYDDLQGKCRECSACTDKLFEIAPCTSFMDTMCVDLKELNKSLWENIKAGQKKEAETFIEETNSLENALFHPNGELHPSGEQPKGILIVADIESPKLRPIKSETIPIWPRHVSKAAVSKNEVDLNYDPWDLLLVAVLSILVVFSFILVIMTLMRYYGFQALQCRPHKTTHSKLVPRDRLNTTEYMKNLAGLDRRLAIDEILEKKKRAIFEPKLVKENIYTDDVFVDISGFPRNLNTNHHYEDLDKKLLLEMEVKAQP